MLRGCNEADYLSKEIAIFFYPITFSSQCRRLPHCTIHSLPSRTSEQHPTPLTASSGVEAASLMILSNRRFRQGDITVLLWLSQCV